MKHCFYFAAEEIGIGNLINELTHGSFDRA